jgi:hypothetical protein
MDNRLIIYLLIQRFHKFFGLIMMVLFGWQAHRVLSLRLVCYSGGVGRYIVVWLTARLSNAIFSTFLKFISFFP